MTAKLSGMIDAAVNGGTKLYEVFFTDTYPYFDESTQTTMKTRELEERLKQLMADQIPLLENGLRIHGIQIMKEPAMEPMHEHMEGRFKETKAEVQRKYGEGHCDIEVSSGKPRAAPPRPVTKMPPSESRSDLSRMSTMMLPHQTSVVESSKHRFYSAITRKKSSANERTSAGRPSVVEEVNGVSGGGGPDSNGSNTSSINLGNDADNSATVVITHRASYLSVGGLSSRPTSGHYLSSTPFR